MPKLIINAELATPPSWFASFRDLTLYANTFLHIDVLLSIDREHTDLYYRFIKQRGGMDFIKQFVAPGEEDGVSLDRGFVCPRTIIAERIAPENVGLLIGKIQGACR